MTYFVYMLECSDGSFYTGYTQDIPARVHAHNNLKVGAKYTKTRRPVKLIYSDMFETRSDAMKREIQIKKLTRSEKEDLVGQNGK